MAAGDVAKKNLTVRIDSQNTQSAAAAARYRRTCVLTKSPARMGFCIQSIQYGESDCKESGLSHENGDVL